MSQARTVVACLRQGISAMHKVSPTAGTNTGKTSSLCTLKSRSQPRSGAKLRAFRECLTEFRFESTCIDSQYDWCLSFQAHASACLDTLSEPGDLHV